MSDGENFKCVVAIGERPRKIQTWRKDIIKSEDINM